MVRGEYIIHISPRRSHSLPFRTEYPPPLVTPSNKIKPHTIDMPTATQDDGYTVSRSRRRPCKPRIRGGLTVQPRTENNQSPPSHSARLPPHPIDAHTITQSDGVYDAQVA